MTEAPSIVDPHQLNEVHVALTKTAEQAVNGTEFSDA